MSEITLGDHVYRIGRLSARQQFDLMRRLGPSLPVFWQEKRPGAEKIDGARWVLGFATGSLSGLAQADSDYILDLCLSVVQRGGAPDAAQVQTMWRPVSKGGAMMFDDIGVTIMMELVDAAIQESLGDFFGALRGGSASLPETETPAAAQ